jgi:hypothetical protein
MLMRLPSLLLIAALLAPAAVHASTATAIGPRIGLSIDPDQFVIGGQMVVGEIAPDVTLNPSIEFGFGDNATVIALNVDGAYHFRVQGSPWRPYLGFGIGINFIEIDRPAPFRDVSDTEVGANLILGAGVPTRTGNRFFTELRFGLGDIPDLKIMAGWLFPL